MVWKTLGRWWRTSRVAVADLSYRCPVCLDDVPEHETFTTPCRHTFCRACLSAMTQPYYILNCPLCRARFEYYVRTKNPVLYPSKADFGFISNAFERRLLQTAYQTISREKKWAYLREFSDPRGYGFLFTTDPVIVNLVTKIADTYAGHTVETIGLTMRRMHKIARIGYEAYEDEYYTSVW